MEVADKTRTTYKTKTRGISKESLSWKTLGLVDFHFTLCFTDWRERNSDQFGAGN